MGKPRRKPKSKPARAAPPRYSLPAICDAVDHILHCHGILDEDGQLVEGMEPFNAIINLHVYMLGRIAARYVEHDDRKGFLAQVHARLAEQADIQTSWDHRAAGRLN